jgi:predicted Zn-dependent protease
MDGKSAAEHVAFVALTGSDVVISSDTGAEFARFGVREARVTSVGDGGIVHVESAANPDALLVIDDALFVSSLRAGGAKVQGIAAGKRALLIGFGCFAALAALMGGFYLAVPHIADALAQRIPLSIEEKLAPKMTALVSKNACTSPRATQTIRALVHRLAPEGEGKIDVRVVNLRMANAFALPGGVVLLTRGLLEEAESADEVAGVLAHELAHVEHRHALSHMLRSALLAGSWAATFGDYSGMMIVDPKTAYDTATLKYSREAEAEADEGALRTLTQRHISSRGLVDFLNRNGKLETRGISWLSSHPSSADRISRLSRQKLEGPAEPALDADSMYDLRKVCDAAHATASIRDIFF